MRWALATHLGQKEHDVRDEVVALALAKTALETGRWTAIWCDNWGNVKAGDVVHVTSAEGKLAFRVAEPHATASAS